MASSDDSGWRLNHVGIRVSDPEKSLKFYKDVIGMEEMHRFDFETLTAWLLVLLNKAYGLSPGNLLDREGVLEIIHVPDSTSLLTNATQNSEFGFFKLCFTVPDLAQAVRRLESANARFVKKPGDYEGHSTIAAGLGMQAKDVSKNQTLWEVYKAIAWVEDPDGYMIELVQKD